MDKNSTVPKKVKSKEYTLRDLPPYGAIPEFVENPFAPPGHRVSVEYSLPERSVSSVLRQSPECGYFSQKLVCCNDVWYHEEYLDEYDNPLSFWYGSRKKEENEEFQEKLKAMQMLDVWAVSPDGEDSENIPENSDCEKPDITPMTEEEKRQKRKFNRNRTKWKFRMLINLNKMHHMYSLSFSYRTNKEIIARGGKPVPGLREILPLEQQRDRNTVMKAVAKGIRRLRQHFKGDFPYIVVLEKHTGQRAEIAADPNKIGTYHIHIATSKYLDARVLQKLWGFGTARTDNFNKKRKSGSRGTNDPGRDMIYDPGLYMSKYMEKDMDDAELHGKRAYSPSQGLVQPKPIRDDAEIAQLLKEAEGRSVVVYDEMTDCEFSLRRKGQEPEQVHFKKRTRILNFRKPSGVSCRREPDDAGGVGASYAPTHSPPGRAQVVGN